ncbi:MULTISPECIES: VWA domain-containing protein [unclassified Nonomuraea]|uniref:vWA domain-containing protein n=1 Tax=unclassified Nonomuraea TaxID=2593643 RepID=UPI0033E4486E
MSDLPGGKISNRPLHFIWILDTSWSMEGTKIGQLNFAIKETLPAMKDTAGDNPNADVLVRVVTFSSGARWHVAQPTPVDQFTWSDIAADGVTDMGKALSLVAEQLRMPPMEPRALPPVLVLVSDGYPTDDFETGLRDLMNEPWGKRAVRLAIGMGEDTDLAVLSKFIGHQEIKPLEANNASTLVQFIRWVSTAVLKSASMPVAPPKDGQPSRPPIPVPPPPQPDPKNTGDDVW